LSDSRIRPEPPAADSAWSLPSLWHRDDSSSSSRAVSAGRRSDQIAWETFEEYRWVTFGGAPKFRETRYPFIDGNKRTAFAATYTFLAINGARLNADASEIYAFVIGLYETNQFNIERDAPWLRRFDKARKAKLGE
jgi:hypothetical protein